MSEQLRILCILSVLVYPIRPPFHRPCVDLMAWLSSLGYVPKKGQTCLWSILLRALRFTIPLPSVHTSLSVICRSLFNLSSFKILREGGSTNFSSPTFQPSIMSFSFRRCKLGQCSYPTCCALLCTFVMHCLVKYLLSFLTLIILIINLTSQVKHNFWFVFSKL